MKRRQRDVHHRFFTAIFLFLATCGPGGQAEEALVASEILDRAREIMKPPVQYRIETSGIESVVSQKELGEQGIAVRTETVSPGFEQIMLMIDGDMLKWSAATKKGYRLTGLLGDMIKKGQALATGAGTPSADPTTAPAGMTVTLQEPTTLDGEECYVIDEILPSGIIDTVLSTLPAGGPIPKGTRSAISKKTGRLMETTQLWRKDDGPAVVTRYRDITPNAELSNELFLPPDDVDLREINSLQEYARLETEATQNAINSWKPEGIDYRIELPPYDEKKGRFVFPPPPGFTADEWDEAVRRIVLEDSLREGDREPGEATAVQKIIALHKSRTPTSDEVVFNSSPTSPMTTAWDPAKAFNRFLLMNACITAFLAWILYRRLRTAKSH